MTTLNDALEFLCDVLKNETIRHEVSTMAYGDDEGLMGLAARMGYHLDPCDLLIALEFVTRKWSQKGTLPPKNLRDVLALPLPPETWHNLTPYDLAQASSF